MFDEETFERQQRASLPFDIIFSIINLGLGITAFVRYDQDMPDIIRNQECPDGQYKLFEAYRIVFPIYMLLSMVALCNKLIKEDQKPNSMDCIISLAFLGFVVFSSMTIADLNSDGCTNPEIRPIVLLEDHDSFYFFTLIWPWALIAYGVLLCFLAICCVSCMVALDSHV